MGLTKYGRREWLTSAAAAVVVIALCAWQGWWAPAIVAAAMWLAVACFFRDPRRRVPRDLPPETLLSPADGRESAVTAVDSHEAVGGPATVIRIFLSVLDVHVNRSPGDGQVTGLEHRRGRFHDARTPQSAVENECQLVTMQLDDGPTIGVRQIAGKVARRIVCDLQPGDRLRRGGRFGMIKFGSGTELILPRALVAAVHVREGDRVKGGITKLATLATSSE
jgi:phosphatidylserine decarboxylase